MSVTPSHTPVRTCIGCRTRFPQATLLRFRRRPDGAVIPATKTLVAGPTARTHNGRSAYLCPARTCYDAALSRRAFTRALSGRKGLSVMWDSLTLWTAIVSTVDRQVEELRQTSMHARIPRMQRLVSFQERLNESGKRGA